MIAVRDFASLKEAEERVQAAMGCRGVLRIKGPVRIAGKAAPAMVQAVGPRVETWFAAGAEASGRLVVIGLKGLDLDGVKAVLGQPAEVA